MIESVIIADYKGQSRQLRKFVLDKKLIPVEAMAMMDEYEIMNIINKTYVAFYTKKEDSDFGMDMEVMYLLSRDVVEKNAILFVR